MNIKEKHSINQISDLLREISAPSRIRILIAVGKEEVCVCHLEATLGMRQAYLSQHLMALRKAGVLVTNRDGRFINYRLANPRTLDIIQNAANLLDVSLDESKNNRNIKNQCSCPKCSSQFNEPVFP
jgi:DNA-binding transcriptional ArsR family regulator